MAQRHKPPALSIPRMYPRRTTRSTLREGHEILSPIGLASLIISGFNLQTGPSAIETFLKPAQT